MKDKRVRTVFSPNFILVILSSSFILYYLRLTKSISPPHFTTILYVVICILLFLIGKIAGERIIIKKKKTENVAFYNRKLIKFVWIGYFITLLLYLLEHFVFISKHGNFPIFISRFEKLRMDFAINGYVHLLAMLSYIFLFILTLEYAFYRKAKATNRYKLLLVLSFVSSTLLAILTGNRGIIISLIMYIVVAFTFTGKIKTGKLYLTGLILIYFLGVANLYRTYLFVGDGLIASISQDWIFGGILILIPLYYSYLAFTMGFNMLNLYILNLKGHFLGYFTIFLPFSTLMPGDQYSLIHLQKDVLGINFHGTLTGTFLLIPYIDFSFFGAFYIMAIGFLLGFLYRKAKTRKLRYVLPYSYLFWHTLLGVYTFSFNKFYVLFGFAIVISISFFLDGSRPRSQN